jgi:hypothetical protein
MRCAVVEFTIAHGETLPTFVYLLNRLGIEVDVYARSQILDSDPFAHCPGLRFSLHSLDSRLIRANLRLRGFRAYDFVIASCWRTSATVPSFPIENARLWCSLAMLPGTSATDCPCRGLLPCT